MTSKLEKLVTSSRFERAILVVIIINAIALGVDTFLLDDTPEMVVTYLNSICLGIFIVEMIMKLIVFKLGYFKDGWNIFDFLIIVFSILPSISFLSAARTCRIFRVFRTFRAAKMISSLKSLRHIVVALINSLPSVGWTFILLGVIAYVYGIIGTELYCRISPEYFGNLWQSLYTLFQLMMADDLGNITRPIIEADGFAVIYFISFSVIAIMMLLNVLIGIMVDSIEDVKKKRVTEAETSKENNDEADLVEEFHKLKEQMDVVSQLLEKNERNSGNKNEG